MARGVDLLCCVVCLFVFCCCCFLFCVVVVFAALCVVEFTLVITPALIFVITYSVFPLVYINNSNKPTKKTQTNKEGGEV